MKTVNVRVGDKNGILPNRACCQLTFFQNVDYTAEAQPGLAVGETGEPGYESCGTAIPRRHFLPL